jgi:hypothetical protein
MPRNPQSSQPYEATGGENLFGSRRKRKSRRKVEKAGEN